MLAYKLLSKRKDGSYGPLFINTRQRIPLNRWLKAENHPTKGFAVRPGWHCTSFTEAPHLVMSPKGKHPRVWCLVEISGKITRIERPLQQGGTWWLTSKMRVLSEVND